VGAPGEIGAHTLRKTFARLIYTALDHDLVRTSYAMRHASVSTTNQYLSFREEEVDAAILRI
jgi:integrase